MQRPFEAYAGDDPYVFVCYSHDDKALMYPELARLRESGFNIWYDEGIAPGSEWSDILAGRIDECALFLYFVTPASVASQHCRHEVNYALEAQRPILAVHLEPTEVPRGLRLSLNARQAILRYDHPADAYRTKLDRAIHAGQANDFGDPRAAATLTLGDWTLDVGTRCLSRQNETHTLDPKAQSVLLHLVDRAPDVVSREGLINHTWPGVVVGDNVLDQAITQLRRALGDDSRDPTYIETLPRRGYRLIARVGTAKATHQAVVVKPESGHRRRAFAFLALAGVAIAAAFWWSREVGSPEASASPTVAVLVFTDLSPAEEFGYLAEALSFDLNDQIREIGFDVLPRSLTAGRSASELPEQVTYVVDGFLQAQDEGVVVGVQLVELLTSRQVWSESFLGTRDDPVELQRQIATRVARYFNDTVRGLESPAEFAQGPQNPAARDAYLAYLKSQLVDDQDQVLESLEHVIELDPAWATGYLLLATEYGWRSHLPGGEVFETKAQRALAEAERLLDDTDPLLLIAQAERVFRDERDYGAAELLYRRAALIPDGFSPLSGNYAQLMLVSGLADEAETVFARVTQEAPAIDVFWSFLAQARGTNGDLEGAYQAATRYSNLTPDTPHAWHYPLYMVLARSGRIDEAKRRLDDLGELIAAGHGNDITPIVERILEWELAFNANDYVTALALAEEAATADHGLAGGWFLRLGDPRARETLLRAWETVDPAYVGLGTMTLTPEQRDSPIWREAVDSIGLTREWRLELCRRASTLPPKTGITCDPSKYALDLSGVMN